MSITTAKWVISPCEENNVKICHLRYFVGFFSLSKIWHCCISRLVCVVSLSLSPSHIIVNSHYCALSSIQWYERVPPINKTSMWQVRVVCAFVCACECVSEKKSFYLSMFYLGSFVELAAVAVSVAQPLITRITYRKLFIVKPFFVISTWTTHSLTPFFF